VCSAAECVAKRDLSCSQRLACGHACGGVRDESAHLPCLVEGCPAHSAAAADCDAAADDYCSVCYVEGLGQAPAIRLHCWHLFHFRCLSDRLARGWPGARITFGFLSCPLCKAELAHPSLQPLLAPLLRLKAEVTAKAAARLAFEGMECDEAFSDPRGKYFGRREEFALDRFAFYSCAKCRRAYFGGRRQCEEAAMAGDEKFNANELVCGGCAAGSDVTNCLTHGKEFVDFKCKFCCRSAAAA